MTSPPSNDNGQTSEYMQLDPVAHFLRYPERDLGMTTVHMANRWIMNDLSSNEPELVNMDIPYNAAIERLFLELLYNAADCAEDSRAMNIDPGHIRVDMTHDTIRIRNYGKPISCGFQPNTNDGRGNLIRKPEFIFGHLLTSSRYSSKSRKVGGKFGIGAKAANICSVYFKVKICNADEGVCYTQVWRNNLWRDADCKPMKDLPEEAKPKIVPWGTVGMKSHGRPSCTEITYTVDFARFYDDDVQFEFAGQRQYTPDILRSFAKHCADVSATANIVVIFNGTEINCTSDGQNPGILKYAHLYYPKLTLRGMYGPKHVLLQTEDSICLLLDTPNQGNTVSFVNSVINEEGGVHVDAWRDACFKPILSHLKDKIKGVGTGANSSLIKLKEIADHISMILMCRLTNPKYKSQTKDKVASPKPIVALRFPDGTNVAIDAIFKWDAVKRMEEIIRGRLSNLSKKSDGKKNKYANVPNLTDAVEAAGPNSMQCYLIITEGKGAKNVAEKGIVDECTGALPIKGKLLNVGTCREDQYANNEEIKAIKEALGLREGTDYSTDSAMNTLRYGGGVIILSDQDVDGMHIRGLIINFFRIKFPSLLRRGYVKIMETSLLRVPYRVGKKTKTLLFYYQKEYNDWIKGVGEDISNEEREKRSSIVPSYYKGLGSSEDSEVLEAFALGRYVTFKWDEKAEDLMSIAFDKGKEDERKDWISSWDPNACMGAYAGIFPQDTVSHFVLNQLCEFSYTNVQRTIPSVVDGLKECQRKVLTVMMDISKKKKVSQIKGMVSDKMHYRYGDEALYRTIVGLGNYCVGTNNFPLIKANGQYDSRMGEVAAPDRYIFASKAKILEYLIRKEDTCILEWKYDGSDRIEPTRYYPIMPLFALNGIRAIGSGYSSDSPSYHPISLFQYIVWWLKVKEGLISTILDDKSYEAPPLLVPWFRNYQGEIERVGTKWYSIGKYEVIKSKKHLKDIMVTEIPVMHTIKTYTAKLDELKEKPITKNWTGTGKDAKCPSWIKEYTIRPSNMKWKQGDETYIEILPRIEIAGPLCATALECGPLRALGLIEKISDSNVVLLDGDGHPHQYAMDGNDGSTQSTAITRAIDAFCEIRYDAYVRRRKAMMAQWKEKIEHLELKRKYIGDVIDQRIKFHTDSGKAKTEAILIGEIESMGYSKEFLDISHRMTTEQGIAKIDHEVAGFKGKIAEYRKTSPSALWYKELEELYGKLQ